MERPTFDQSEPSTRWTVTEWDIGRQDSGKDAAEE
jgi:hypothetical protein